MVCRPELRQSLGCFCFAPRSSTTCERCPQGESPLSLHPEHEVFLPECLQSRNECPAPPPTLLSTFHPASPWAGFPLVLPIGFLLQAVCPDVLNFAFSKGHTAGAKQAECETSL